MNCGSHILTKKQVNIVKKTIQMVTLPSPQVEVQISLSRSECLEGTDEKTTLHISDNKTLSITFN